MNLLNKLMQVKTVLHYVLYVSYLVPASRVRPLVPDILPLAAIGDDNAFISVVILKSTAVRLRALPFPRFTYNQMNTRTYVIDPQSNNQAVYFIKSGVTSSIISLLTRTIGIPWQFIDLDLQVTDDTRTHHASYTASGDWRAKFSVHAEITPLPPTHMAPFGDTVSAIDYLVRPLIGFYGRSGTIGRFRIWHPDVEPSAAQLRLFRFPLLHEIELINETEIENPHSVLFVPEARFHIYLPPVWINTATKEEHDTDR